jgi:beta-glucosidase-like glycosyl hydrolase
MKLSIKHIFSLIAFSFLSFAHADDLEQRIRNRFVVANSFMNSPLHYGGYVMYHQEMDKNLCKMKNGMLFLVDHEGGRVNRLNSPLPAANSTIDKEKLYSLWENDVKALKNKCFDMVLGPTIDTSFGDRSYTSDLATNLIIANKISTIIQSQKMIPTYKHFPGELPGCKAIYTRKEIRVCPQGMDEIKMTWLPFKNNKAPSLMISNFIYEKYSKLPAVIDKSYYDYLRKDLNYQGVILTDALWEMSIPLTENIVWEIFKNADLLMIMNPLEAEKFVPIIAKKIKNDPQEMTNLEEKEKRVTKMKGLL